MEQQLSLDCIANDVLDTEPQPPRRPAAEVNFMDLSISSSNQESPDMPQALPQLDSPTGNPVALFPNEEGSGGDKFLTPHLSPFKASAEATLHSPTEEEPSAFNFEVVPPADHPVYQPDDQQEEASSPDEIPQPLPDVVPKQLTVKRTLLEITFW